jgi:hypothetical protein
MPSCPWNGHGGADVGRVRRLVFREVALMLFALRHE